MKYLTPYYTVFILLFTHFIVFDSTGVGFCGERHGAGKRTAVVDIILGGNERQGDTSYVGEMPPEHSESTLIINEIMYDPLTGHAEWVELFNPGSIGIDLCGWEISDSDTSKKSVITEHGTIVPPSGYAVISERPIIYNYPASEGIFLTVEKFPRLNNDADAVVLFDPSGIVIDRVDYRNEWGGGDGYSLERINPRIAYQDNSNWTTSTAVEGATPGRENSVFMVKLPTEIMLSVSPNPFSPDGDGYEDEAIISYQLPMVTSYINLRIYDVRGRCIRILKTASASGSQGSVVWDGRDDEGRLARIGIYIIYFEGLDSMEGIVASAKSTVVLAGRL
jgi:hypothetical protein